MKKKLERDVVWKGIDLQTTGDQNLFNFLNVCVSPSTRHCTPQVSCPLLSATALLWYFLSTIILQLFVLWPLWRGYLRGVEDTFYWPLPSLRGGPCREVWNKSKCMDLPPARKKMTVAQRWEGGRKWRFDCTSCFFYFCASKTAFSYLFSSHLWRLFNDHWELQRNQRMCLFVSEPPPRECS